MNRLKLMAVMCMCMTALIFASAQVTQAQEDATCPDVVQTALEQIDMACAETGRNEVCYGHIAVGAEGASDLSFTAVGDIARITAVDRLTLSPYDDKEVTWGLALMQIQANIPATIPGQNVTFLMFGDVTLDNAGATAVEVTTTAVSAVSTAPDDVFVAELPADVTLRATGQDETGDWLRVLMPDGWEAWLLADEVTTTADLSTLPVITADSPPFYGPMQAVYFRTGIGNAGCEAMPDDGVLVQTPGEVGTVTLAANEVIIEMGSTLYMQAVPNGDMTISTVEGTATVTASGVSVTVPAGMQVTIPLDANAIAAGPPNPPKAYTPAQLAALPTLSLKTPVPVAAPLAFDDYYADLKARAEDHMAQGLYLFAIADFTELAYVAADDTQQAAALADRGYAHVFLGENETAIRDFTDSIALVPDVGETYFGRGLAYQTLAQFELAIADYEQAVEQAPDNADYVYSLGLAYFFNGQIDEAITTYTRTLAIDPDYVDAYRERGNLYYEGGLTEEALADYRAYVDRVEVPAQEIMDRIAELE